MNKKDKNEILWVQGDPAEVLLVLRNPLPVEMKVEKMVCCPLFLIITSSNYDCMYVQNVLITMSLGYSQTTCIVFLTILNEEYSFAYQPCQNIVRISKLHDSVHYCDGPNSLFSSVCFMRSLCYMNTCIIIILCFPLIFSFLIIYIFVPLTDVVLITLDILIAIPMCLDIHLTCTHVYVHVCCI